jgi:hypothetical protein
VLTAAGASSDTASTPGLLAQDFDQLFRELDCSWMSDDELHVDLGRVNTPGSQVGQLGG